MCGASSLPLPPAHTQVQKASTPTYLSAISSTSHPNGKAIATGDPITLAWQFVGAGSAVCTHDGAPVSNGIHGKCVSPLTVTARAFGSAATTHEVRVVFTDVCGRERTAKYSYTQAGLTVLTAPEVVTTTGGCEAGAPGGACSPVAVLLRRVAPQGGSALSSLRVLSCQAFNPL